MSEQEEIYVDGFGDFFPQIENILHFGTYYSEFESNSIKWSPGIYKILGLDNQSELATIKRFYDFVHPDDLELVVTTRAKSFETFQPYHIEFSIITANAEKKRVCAENHLILDENGKPLGYRGLLKDITEKHENLKMLESKIEQLDKSNHNLQEFVYVASHDLQEPLRKVSTFSERLQTKYGDALDDEGNRYVNRIAASCRSMQTLLEDLLDFSRLSFDNKSFENISLEKIIHDLVKEMDLKEGTVAEVKCEETSMIDAYTSQLKQLFSNLIYNSIKFRKKDSSVLIKVDCQKVNYRDYPQFKLEKDRNYIRIEIADDGIGFDQEFSEKIFQIFQRLHGKVEYSGSGIGLSICKKIVENHKGFIFAEGIPNQGAKFTILLPQTQT